MKSWKSLFSDKRWMLLMGILAFALLATWCESRTRREPQPVAQKEGGTESAAGRDAKRQQQPRQLPEEFEGTTAVVEQPKPEQAPATPIILRRIRTGQHDDFDRVVFDFESPTPPGFHVEYIDKLALKCGLEELKTSGRLWLLVRMSPALAHQESGRTSLEKIEFDEDLQLIKDIRGVCDSDGQLQWLIEVTDRKAYRAEALFDPARIVIDIKHQ
ncbi:MAG TPA: hypothetical protein VGC64_02820 [Pyrinomonadaceae bacterium]|jgi:hypothetical protein